MSKAMSNKEFVDIMRPLFGIDEDAAIRSFSISLDSPLENVTATFELYPIKKEGEEID